CPLLAQSGHGDRAELCPLSGVKRTLPLRYGMSAFDPKRAGHIKPPRRSPVELCCQLRWASRNIETQVDFRRWPEFVFEIQVHAPTWQPRCFSNCRRHRPDETFHQTRMFCGSGLDLPASPVPKEDTSQ